VSPWRHVAIAFGGEGGAKRAGSKM
jgi:hypothetical protein